MHQSNIKSAKFYSKVTLERDWEINLGVFLYERYFYGFNLVEIYFNQNFGEISRPEKPFESYSEVLASQSNRNFLLKTANVRFLVEI